MIFGKYSKQEVLAVMAAIVIAWNTIFSLIPTKAPGARCYGAEEPDKVLLEAAVVADIHTDAKFFRDRTNVLRKSFAGISKCREKLDAVVLAGDNTNCGDEEEYKLLRRLGGFWLRCGRILPAIGNHDSWHHSDDPDWELARTLFLDYCSHCGIKTEKTYYSTEVNGFDFIMLGTEKGVHNDAFITDEQIEWFDSELGRAVAEGKPVFIICHQTLAGKNGTSPDDVDNDSVGEASVKLAEIIERRSAEGTAPVLFFSGHMHTLGGRWFEKSGNAYFINLPSLEYTYGGGIGALVEVYDGRVLLRLRNFVTDTYLSSYERRIEFS